MFNVHLPGPLHTHKSRQRGRTLNCSNDDAKALFISGPNASDTGNIYLAGGGGDGGGGRVDLNCSDLCNTSGSFATPSFLPCNLFLPFLISIFLFLLRLRKWLISKQRSRRQIGSKRPSFRLVFKGDARSSSPVDESFGPCCLRCR